MDIHTVQAWETAVVRVQQERQLRTSQDDGLNSVLQFQPVNDCQEFRCSACGEYMVMQQFPGCADDAPSYCPSCGRKVVKQ